MFFSLQKNAATLLERATRLIPHICALCHSTSASGICDVCMARYFINNNRRCSNCANLLFDDKSDTTFCGACLKRKPAFDRTIAAVDYLPPIDQLVQSLKFGSNLALAPIFARLIHAAIQKHYPEDLPQPSMLTAVPLASDRLATRGFNQAIEIAKPLSTILAIPLMPHLVSRIRETAPQTVITRKERQKNIRGAFALRETAQYKIKGQHIGIVDDVLTTGETMEELASSLKKAGASYVSCFVFARTPP